MNAGHTFEMGIFLYLVFSTGLAFFLVINSGSRWKRAFAIKMIFDVLVIFTATFQPAGFIMSQGVSVEATLLIVLGTILTAASLSAKRQMQKSAEPSSKRGREQ